MANLPNVCYAPGHAHGKYFLVWGENQLVHTMSNRYCTSGGNHHREQELEVEAYAQGQHLLVEDYSGSYLSAIASALLLGSVSISLIVIMGLVLRMNLFFSLPTLF